jgi:PTS system nitrogen regulatory IIA component
MKIKDFLLPIHARTGIRVADKTGLLRELSNQAGKALNVSPESILTELLKREKLGSTGTGGGVAIPHARMPEVKTPFGILLRLDEAVSFDAIDGQPVDVVFLLLLPAIPTGSELAALASVARKLRDPIALRGLRRASDANALFDTIVQNS